MKTREGCYTYRWFTRLLSRLAREENEKKKRGGGEEGRRLEIAEWRKGNRRTMMVADGAVERRRGDEGGRDGDEGKEIRRNAYDRSQVPYSRIEYGEDKETQLRITLRWRLMGGNKKGHRVATAAERGETPLHPVVRVPCARGERCHPTSCRTYRFSSQNSPGSVRFERARWSPLRVWTATCRRSGQCCSIRGYPRRRYNAPLIDIDISRYRWYRRRY